MYYFRNIIKYFHKDFTKTKIKHFKLKEWTDEENQGKLCEQKNFQLLHKEPPVYL